MILHIPYGRGTVTVNTGAVAADWQIFWHTGENPLADSRQAFLAMCRNPIGEKPLRELVRPEDHVIIVTSDGTRPVPNRRLIPWLLEELPCQPEHVSILLGNGSHRPNTRAEIAEMFGAEVARSVAIHNHSASNPAVCEEVGRVAGGPVLINRRYLEADFRILVGFIEPHFFAGYSGGAKGIVPGIAGMETILHVHRYELIGHPASTWRSMAQNPVQQEIRRMVALCPPEFLINVTLNPARQITGIFAGHYLLAQEEGIRRLEKNASAAVHRRFPVVLTSNSGYPLDQNLYQTVKGISAAAQIAEPGGTIFIVSECADGIPDHGKFAELMAIGNSPEEVLAAIRALESPAVDQWEAQLLARLEMAYRIKLYSSLPEEQVRRCKLEPVANLEEELRRTLQAYGPHPPVAALPDGPQFIPRVHAEP